MAIELSDRRHDLFGWKAIANYLGVRRSTAITWARGKGLPVYRCELTKGISARRKEIDDWRYAQFRPWARS